MILLINSSSEIFSDLALTLLPFTAIAANGSYDHFSSLRFYIGLPLYLSLYKESLRESIYRESIEECDGCACVLHFRACMHRWVCVHAQVGRACYTKCAWAHTLGGGLPLGLTLFKQGNFERPGTAFPDLDDASIGQPL